MAHTAHKNPILNIPNLLTGLRLLMVPFVIWLLLTGHLKLALGLFILAGITDGIDGYLARKWRNITKLGTYLDPVADKALIVSLFLTLGYLGLIPLWLIVIVVGRDLLILGGIFILWLINRPLQIVPLSISKANTALQILCVAFVLGNHGFALSLDGLTGLFLITALTTTLSAISYFIVWIGQVRVKN